ASYLSLFANANAKVHTRTMHPVGVRRLAHRGHPAAEGGMRYPRAGCGEPAIDGLRTEAASTRARPSRRCGPSRAADQWRRSETPCNHADMDHDEAPRCLGVAAVPWHGCRASRNASQGAIWRYFARSCGSVLAAEADLARIPCG